MKLIELLETHCFYGMDSSFIKEQKIDNILLQFTNKEIIITGNNFLDALSLTFNILLNCEYSKQAIIEINDVLSNIILSDLNEINVNNLIPNSDIRISCSTTDSLSNDEIKIIIHIDDTEELKDLGCIKWTKTNKC
jgi:hypothetical protein